MNIDKLLAKKVKKLTVKDLKKVLKDADDDAEVILCFNWKDGEDKVVSCYLAEILTNLKYDSVLKERLDSVSVLELAGYNDEFCIYIEDKK